ncbi:bifunctional oligoribonuclease/PAP phosphatase NrnA [Patescibacteria group bacterium]|nr:bifunctional oligoribonuclease/PAP phosphatase NrnA [Patescibacteria group bacterium]
MPGEMTPKQQWSELVKNAKTVLILPHANPDGDALGSALAMKIGLEKLGKEVTLAVSGQLSQSFNFLPHFATITTDASLQKDLLIVVDESQARVANVSLKRAAENKLMIVITPKDGLLTETNLHIEEGSFNVDLIIAIDCADPERLGDIYEENSSLFYEVPVVNIDHHPGNTNFGKVNIVDLTASSTAEILVSLLETIGKETPDMLDPDIATCLLTGITTDTGSFQNNNTTPKSLTVAAQLVAAGGRQQEIIKNLFKTRTLSTLRLWGRALSYIKEDQPHKFAWSILNKADFVAAQAKPEEASGVIDELLKTASGMDFVLLMTERDGGIHGSFRSTNPTVDVSALAALFGGGGHPQAAAFQMANATLAQKEMEIIHRLQAHLNGEKPASPLPSEPELAPQTEDEDMEDEEYEEDFEEDEEDNEADDIDDTDSAEPEPEVTEAKITPPEVAKSEASNPDTETKTEQPNDEPLILPDVSPAPKKQGDKSIGPAA